MRWHEVTVISRLSFWLRNVYCSCDCMFCFIIEFRIYLRDNFVSLSFSLLCFTVVNLSNTAYLIVLRCLLKGLLFPGWIPCFLAFVVCCLSFIAFIWLPLLTELLFASPWSLCICQLPPLPLPGFWHSVHIIVCVSFLLTFFHRLCQQLAYHVDSAHLCLRCVFVIYLVGWLVFNAVFPALTRSRICCLFILFAFSICLQLAYCLCFYSPLWLLCTW